MLPKRDFSASTYSDCKRESYSSLQLALFEIHVLHLKMLNKFQPIFGFLTISSTIVYF